MKRSEPPESARPISGVIILLAGLLAGGSMALFINLIGGDAGVIVGLASLPVVFVGILFAGYAWSGKE